MGGLSRLDNTWQIYKAWSDHLCAPYSCFLGLGTQFTSAHTYMTGASSDQDLNCFHLHSFYTQFATLTLHADNVPGVLASKGSQHCECK